MVTVVPADVLFGVLLENRPRSFGFEKESLPFEVCRDGVGGIDLVTGDGVVFNLSVLLDCVRGVPVLAVPASHEEAPYQ
ncbi:hypothetical protein [Cupriavidus sp. D39]|uniref:hypothetical protein n=1 Tax=Cupriavidus sp. D39 TaxID=2997877 RepID=UPI00226D6EDE|nr:hypothetical protein [Cupriavidus sp. D39]MCY0853603.1 hypothetical protein [Cupriavidus sp. D39]